MIQLVIISSISIDMEGMIHEVGLRCWHWRNRMFCRGIFWMVTFIQNVGVPQVRMMQTLNSTNLDIGALGTDEQGHGLFLTRNNLQRTTQLFQDRMSQQGWTYTGQEGSGYFFKKGRQTAVVTTRIMHRKFIQIQVQHNVVNIADSSTTNKTHSSDSL